MLESILAEAYRLQHSPEGLSRRAVTDLADQIVDLEEATNRHAELAQIDERRCYMSGVYRRFLESALEYRNEGIRL